jgi:hypothetical protein
MTSSRASALSWEPRRDAHGLYCAPACGRGCTLAEYKDALKRAETLAKRLGPGWTPRVHENLGWHSKVIDETGLWKVHVNQYYGMKKPTYLAFLGESDIGGRWAESADTPEAAIDAVLTIARREFASLEKLLEGAQGILIHKLTRDVEKIRRLRKKS